MLDSDKPASAAIEPTSNIEALLGRLARDMQGIRSMLNEVVNYMKDAESEVPEKMRRFIMYHHDIHDAVNQHAELGLEVPTHILREAERCDDRLRQLLEALHTDGAAFEKVRREMSKDPNNRWDHSRLLTKGKASA